MTGAPIAALCCFRFPFGFKSDLISGHAMVFQETLKVLLRDLNPKGNQKYDDRCTDRGALLFQIPLRIQIRSDLGSCHGLPGNSEGSAPRFESEGESEIR